MGFKDKAIDIAKKVSDNTEQVKILDEKQILEQTKKDLLQLKDDVRYAEKVSDELQKAGWIDAILAAEWKQKLKNTPEKQETLTKIADKVEEVRTQFDTMDEEQKEKVKKMTVVLTQIRTELFGLKEQIVDTKKIEEQTIQAATAELNKHWYSRGLVGPYKQYLHRKFEKLHTPQNAKELSIGETIKEVVLDGFYSVIGLLGGLFVGKGVLDLVDNLSLDAIKKKGAELLDNVKNIDPQATLEDITPEGMKKGEAILKRKIDDFVEKRFDKKLTPEQLDRVAKKMSTKDLLQENQKMIDFLASGGAEGTDANLFHAGIEGLVLPFSMITDLLSALKEEGVIDTKEIVFNVTGDVVEYGLKGFKLFGSGLSLALGKISLEQFGKQIGTLYQKSPEEAKQLLFALIYRGQHSPVFKLMLNSAEWLAKMPMFFLADMNDSVKSLGHIKDVYRGNIDTAIKQLEQTAQYLPDNFGGGALKSAVISAKESMKKMGQVNEAVKVIHELGDTISVADFQKQLAKNGISLVDLPPGVSEKITKASNGMVTSKILKRALAEDILEITRGMTNKFGLKSGLSKAFGEVRGVLKGEANPYRVIENMSHYLEDVGKQWSNIVGHESGLVRGISKVKLSSKLVNESIESGKFMYHFETVQDFEGFVKKTKFLMKSSPGSLKFLIGKSPIFIVGGLAVGEGDTLSEKMKSLITGMEGLFPIVGPWMIMSDAGIMKEGGPDIGQLALGGVLMGVDSYTIIRRLARKDFVGVAKYMAQPFVDARQIGKFLINGGRRAGVLGKGFVSLVKSEGLLKTIVGVGKRVGTRSRLSRLGILTAVAAGGYFTRDYLFASNDLDEETKTKLAEYKDNPDKLDQDIQKQWPTLSQDEKNDYIRAAILRQGGFSPSLIGDLDVQFANNEYSVLLPSVIAHDDAIMVKDVLADALSHLQPGSSIDIRFAGPARFRFTKELQEQFADVDQSQRQQKMEEYVRAMGYEDPMVILDEKNIT